VENAGLILDDEELNRVAGGGKLPSEFFGGHFV